MVTQSMNNTMLGSSLLKSGPGSSRTCFDPPLSVPKGARSYHLMNPNYTKTLIK